MLQTTPSGAPRLRLLDFQDALIGPLVYDPVSYTHLRAHETVLDLVCRLLLEKKKPQRPTSASITHTDVYNEPVYKTHREKCN